MKCSKFVYIATGLENFEEHNLLARVLADQGIGITYDWTHHGPVYREGARRCAEVAAAESNGVIIADAVVILLPGGRGTHVELGIAIGANSVQEYPRPIILYGQPNNAKRLGLIDGREMCAFYFHEQVTIVIGALSDLVSVICHKLADEGCVRNG